MWTVASYRTASLSQRVATARLRLIRLIAVHGGACFVQLRVAPGPGLARLAEASGDRPGRLTQPRLGARQLVLGAWSNRPRGLSRNGWTAICA